MASRCPFTSPLRCVDGSCVETYQDCVAAAKVNKVATAYTNPILWGAEYDQTSA